MVSTSGSHVQRKTWEQSICQAVLWYSQVTAIHQKLVFSLFTVFMLNLYTVMYFIPEWNWKMKFKCETAFTRQSGTSHIEWLHHIM